MSIMNFGALAAGKTSASAIEGAISKAFAHTSVPALTDGLLAAEGGATHHDGKTCRRRLWELSHKHHCPIIGVCFEVDELRQIIGRVLNYPAGTADYVWHTIAVGICDERCPLSEKFGKLLDQRYAQMIRRLAGRKAPDELRQAWREICQQGSEIPAGLWATCTHPACDAALEQEIHADIHMIQHQLGAGRRADREAAKTLRTENAGLRRELALLRSRFEQHRNDHIRDVQEFNQRLLGLQTELVARDAMIARHKQELDVLRQDLPDLLDRQQLALRLQDAEQCVRALKVREKEQEMELVRLRDFAKFAEETIESLTHEESDLSFASAVPDTLPDEALLGKCVLCVGGRSGAINSYREVVETKGGRFMHHDGGREENLQRIDGALAAADIVICQVGCISHNAYWRVKEQCKRTGKPCMFVKSTGIGSFGRIVGEAGRNASASGEF